MNSAAKENGIKCLSSATPTGKRVRIIIPVYNERENIVNLLDQLLAILPALEGMGKVAQGAVMFSCFFEGYVKFRKVQTIML